MASSKNPTETRLDNDVTTPATTAPGDAPADTTDPKERASTVTPHPGKEALKVGTVNAVMPIEPVAEDEATAKKDQRIEKYEATRPDGSKVTVTHNIDTGETSVS